MASRGSASDIDAPHVRVIALIFTLLGIFSAELYVVGGESHFYIFPSKILFYSRPNAHASNLQSHCVRRMPSCRCTVDPCLKKENARYSDAQWFRSFTRVALRVLTFLPSSIRACESFVSHASLLRH